MAIVTYVLGDCKGCGAKDSFGNVDVYSTHVYRGCMRCGHNERVALPKVKKTVLYLDQFFFSHAFRAGDERFLKAAGRIARLCSLQLLVVPYSSIHEDETHQWSRREELMKFIKTTARGEEFVPAYDVERTQLVKAFRAWLAGSPPAYRLEQSDALRREVDVWDGYLWIDVGRYIGDTELMRDLKRQSTEGLVDLFDGWRQSTASFETDVQAEHRAAGKGYIDFYLDYVSRMATGDSNAMFDAPLISMVVETILHLVPDDVPVEQRLRKCAEFLMTSEHFKEAPYQWLHAQLLATLKAMVKEGAFTHREKALHRLKGFFYDVKHISTYAPYVDAFVMDQPMADLVARPTVGLEHRYGTKVFSLKNWDDLFALLDQVEAVGMTETNRQGLSLAYPGLL